MWFWCHWIFRNHCLLFRFYLQKSILLHIPKLRITNNNFCPNREENSQFRFNLRLKTLVCFRNVLLIQILTFKEFIESILIILLLYLLYFIFIYKFIITLFSLSNQSLSSLLQFLPMGEIFIIPVLKSIKHPLFISRSISAIFFKQKFIKLVKYSFPNSFIRL